MIWWPLYGGDFARDTANLTPIEVGCYIRLLIWCYAKESALPLDSSECCRIAGVSSTMERHALDRVIVKFFTREESGFVNARCAVEIARWQEKSAKSKAAADKRWEKEKAVLALIGNGKKTR